MTTQEPKNLRLIFPQWQGGNNESYFFGSRMLAWLAPEGKGITAEVEVAPPEGVELQNEEGIVGRSHINRQLAAAHALILQHNPETIVTLGGDCLVSLAPFAYLAEKYGDRLGILWVDSHPDVMASEQFSHSHAHVLGALLGNGDHDLTKVVSFPVSASRVMIAGIHDPLEYEKKFIDERGIATCSPEALKAGSTVISDWITRENIEFLAIHLDLDVLDPALFRSVLFARPGRDEHDFGDVAEGRLSISEVVNLINEAAGQARPVGLTVAEHLPWDAINLRKMLGSLPLIR